ncbi:MAG: TSUP family transporter [Alphaproteobacteria bacterium]|nr:TSUP family transporter [Alphaproteobacteria bacterium]
MPETTLIVLLATVLATSTISGVFGMAGGLIMKGVLVSYLPVASSMVLHGFIQIVSNASRATLLVRHISWKIVGRYAIGVVGGIITLALLNWRPSQTAVFFLLGFTAMMVQIPRSWIELNADRRFQAEICGYLVQVVNTLAGVAGPVLDIFFVKTQLTRQTVVATKSTTQVMAHAVKIAFWGGPLLAALSDHGGQPVEFPPAWMFAAVIPLSLLGTWLGGRALDRLSDVGFRKWTKWLVTATGAGYLGRGLLAVLGLA